MLNSAAIDTICCVISLTCDAPRRGGKQRYDDFLSYEQLTRFAERRIRECNLDSQGAIYLCESAKAGAVLIFWHELAINGYASMNAIKRQELIDADFQRLRNLIWPEDDR